ncbi:MAG: tetratricopeptide repeat protein [Candidatus Hodarchaeales archaeon]
MKNKNLTVLLLLCVTIIAISIYTFLIPHDKQTEKQLTPESNKQTISDRQLLSSSYVGIETCAGCHQQQYILWQGSHHDQSMQEANEETILGDFNDREFTYFDITSKFYEKDARYYVLTDGPDGKLQEYEIKYTFGIYPLQQYLVEFPDGRLQALGVAWDTRPQSEGGRKWFHLYPDEEIKYDDPLHWTGINQNWNYMCAECHSTNVEKNYNHGAGNYETTWSEINVSCESCHGPGSNHIDWVERKDKGYNSAKGLLVTFDDRKDVNWTINTKTGNSQRSRPKVSEAEIEICARCHSRRSIIWEEYEHGKPLMDTHLPALIEDGYYPDGQILEEVYVHGSFLQSKMYGKGVTCADCHNPHSLQLNKNGNELCSTCHLSSKYDSLSHHHHKELSEGAECIGCHMPDKKYMVVDPRHDHSIRIPRPDLSINYGTPNACNNCHSDKDAKWASGIVNEWYGDKISSYNNYAGVFYSSRSGMPDSEQLLLELAMNGSAPDIVRATALRELGEYLSPQSIDTVSEGLNDPDPMVRAAAVDSLESLDISNRLELLFNLLNDPVRGVRIKAARMLAPSKHLLVQPDKQQTLNKALNEYIKTQEINLDRPEANLNLGNIYTQMGEFDKAEVSVKRAISLDPNFIPAYVNLADLYRLQQRDDLGENILEKALKIDNKSSEVHYALGLLLVRAKRLDEADYHLGEAAKLSQDNPRYSYVYSVLLNSTGKANEAINVLEQTIKEYPYNKEILIALITFNSDLGKTDEAKRYYEKYKEYYPLDPNIGILEEQLKR